MALAAAAYSRYLLLLSTSDHQFLLLPVLMSVVAVLVLQLLRRSSWMRKKMNNSGGGGKGLPPPGSVGLPLVGETLRLIAAYKTEDPEPFMDERVRRHGRLFTTHVFGERTVFSADPEFNRVVLGGEGRSVECSYPSSISTLLGRHSLLLMRGALHKRMHSLTLTRLASPAAIRDSPLLLHIDRLVQTTLDSWAAQSRVLLLDQAKKITFDLTVKQLVSYDPGDWTEALRREYLLLIEGFFSIPFPSFLSFTTYGRAIKVSVTGLVNLLAPSIIFRIACIDLSTIPMIQISPFPCFPSFPLDRARRGGRWRRR